MAGNPHHWRWGRIVSDWKPNIDVTVERDGDGWFAECKSLDYVACGSTVEETKEHFRDGVMATAMLHRERLSSRHRCKICAATGKGLITPSFDWHIYASPTPQIGEG